MREKKKSVKLFFFEKVIQVQAVHINHIIITIMPPVSSQDLLSLLYGGKSMMTRFLVACWASMLDSFFFFFFERQISFMLDRLCISDLQTVQAIPGKKHQEFILYF